MRGSCLLIIDDYFYSGEIITYPHHKHIGPSDRLAPSDQPSLHQVLTEIEGWLNE